ncbi:AMP-binding protein [Iamia majanohamensis]|uniref:AMP-binding protein n=1 Tax=Iamia majanohamensis TaxID=467976 RepID=A0AAE9YDM5_9ACTN|nr:AMP-binding protein [Iamia majanohamensis]WCO65891.1 AMP-binding protein [Iamia majanohamensis]
MTSAPTGSPRGLGPWRRRPLPEGFRPFPDGALEGSIGERLLATCATAGDRTALRSPAGQWSYAALADDVRSTAAGVQAAVGREEPTPVALLATHDGPLVVALLGIVVAGHVVVVLDPASPPEQTAEVLAESGAPLLLHDAAHAEAAAALGAAVEGCTVASCASIADRGDPSAPLPHRGPDDPVMLAFTSGTSGGPKGATITHRVLLNLVRGATNALGIGPHDRMPMLFPTSLAVAAYPLFLPLLNGGTLATLDVRSVGLAPVADFLADERITLAYMAPTVVRFLVDALAGRSFPDLRMIALGGELVDAEVVRLTREALAPDLIANGFGTTETGVITLYVLDPDEELDGPVPAGYPVDDVDLLVLDDTGEPRPAGEAGEVAITSPHVFSGYWGHPEATAQVVAPDPEGRPGWTLYRTGDLGRLDEHGALTVLGRMDTKVKVRGRFVVIGDVEARIRDLAEVADAAVVPTATDGIVELTAVVTAAGADPLEATTLRRRMLESVDAYQVPGRWQVVPELPRLPNGKLDRQALSAQVPDAPDPRSAGADAGPEAPVTAATAFAAETERAATLRAVRDLWEAMLPSGVVGPDDDFADLGGDSLLAAQMLVELEGRLGVTVPMGRLVHARTPRLLADVVLQVADGPTSTVACVQPGDPDRPRLWFVHDLQGSAYRIRHLAAHLGAEQPVWSFESPLLRGIENPYRHLDAFAARYVTDLREAQPEGPYWLGGYSFGGVCAYEMARQLARDGHEVAFVGIADVGPGYRGPGWGDDRSPLRPWFGIAPPPPEGADARARLTHYRRMVERSPAAAARHLMVRTGASRLVDPIRFRADLRRTGRVRPEWRLWYAWEEHWRLASRHWDRANPYGGPVDLFWAEDTPSADATMGWGPLVPEVRIHRYEGDHMGTLEPRGAPHLAAALRTVLDDVQAARRA